MQQQQQDSWCRYCHQTNDGLSILIIMSRNLVFLDLRTLQKFIGFCLLCKNTGLCWHTNQFLRSPALLVYCEDRENLSDFGIAGLDWWHLAHTQLSHYLTLIKPQDYCFQNKLRSLLYKVRASTSSILVRQRHVLWGRYVLFQTQPLNTNACLCCLLLLMFRHIKTKTLLLSIKWY